MRITEATPAEVALVLQVEREAFGGEEVPSLVAELLDDPTARPLLSLLAWDGGEAIGHVMFTRARIDGAPDLDVSILAPLAVIPGRQGQGIGGRLIEEGIERLSEAGTDLVFVLGHPGYYPRHGFSPALPLGLDAPYPIVPPEAWMVRAIRYEHLGAVTGVVRCADALARPEHWRE